MFAHQRGHFDANRGVVTAGRGRDALRVPGDPAGRHDVAVLLLQLVLDLRGSDRTSAQI